MKKGGYTLSEIIIVVALVGTALVVFPMWTNRNLDFWISHVKGHAVNVPYWISIVITVIGNDFIITANIIGEVCRFLV